MVNSTTILIQLFSPNFGCMTLRVLNDQVVTTLLEKFERQEYISFWKWGHL